MGNDALNEAEVWPQRIKRDYTYAMSLWLAIITPSKQVHVAVVG